MILPRYSNHDRQQSCTPSFSQPEMVFRRMSLRRILTRKPSILVKATIAVPVVWFSLLGFIDLLTGQSSIRGSFRDSNHLGMSKYNEEAEFPGHEMEAPPHLIPVQPVWERHNSEQRGQEPQWQQLNPLHEHFGNKDEEVRHFVENRIHNPNAPGKSKQICRQTWKSLFLFVRKAQILL